MDELGIRQLDAAMLRLADGDRTAGSLVFSLLWPEVIRLAERVVGKGGDADDAAQEAMEKVFAQASNFDPTRSALGWALAITGWQCKSILRRRARRREESLERANEVLASEPDPEDVAIEQSMRVALREILSGLPMNEQNVLEEAFVLEASGPRDPAFRKRKERALGRLRLAWRKIYGD